jgi:LAO/AO transport system kinase
VAARDLATAMKLITSDPHARRPPVLTCSAYTGDGLDALWQAVLDHRAYVEAHGGLEMRRNAQQLEWLWALVRGELEDALRRSPSVRTIKKSLEHQVGSGDLSALEASTEILAAFAKDSEGLFG